MVSYLKRIINFFIGRNDIKKISDVEFYTIKSDDVLKLKYEDVLDRRNAIYTFMASISVSSILIVYYSRSLIKDLISWIISYLETPKVYRINPDTNFTISFTETQIMPIRTIITVILVILFLGIILVILRKLWIVLIECNNLLEAIRDKLDKKDIVFINNKNTRTDLDFEKVKRGFIVYNTTPNEIVIDNIYLGKTIIAERIGEVIPPLGKGTIYGNKFTNNGLRESIKKYNLNENTQMVFESRTKKKYIINLKEHLNN